VWHLRRGVAVPAVSAGGVGVGVAVMDGVLSSALRDATYGWLDRLEALARAADMQSRALLAETELVRLILAWRAVLGEHEPGEDGRCPAGTGWRRRRGYRCSVWVSAHRCLVVNDTAGCRGARHSLVPGREPSW
jgi:hypothetical protein